MSANARRRLRHIEEYEKRKGNAAKGRRITRKIYKRAKELEKNPELGPPEENLKRLGMGHRSLLVGTLYRIVYL
ncbi:MAG: type II toxin-antitoxin system RelE/ParE family toxin, partial [Bacteroidota bacterium]